METKVPFKGQAARQLPWCRKGDASKQLRQSVGEGPEHVPQELSHAMHVKFAAHCAASWQEARPVSYTHLTLPTTPYV